MLAPSWTILEKYSSRLGKIWFNIKDIIVSGKIIKSCPTIPIYFPFGSTYCSK